MKTRWSASELRTYQICHLWLDSSCTPPHFRTLKQQSYRSVGRDLRIELMQLMHEDVSIIT